MPVMASGMLRAVPLALKRLWEKTRKHVNKHIFEQTDKTSTGCEPLRSGAQLHFQIQQQEQCLQPRECRWRRGSRRG